MGRRWATAPSRRAALSGIAAAAAGLLAAALAYGYLIEPRRIVVERVSIAVRDLPAELEGFTLVHISDLHCGPGRRWAPHLRRAVRTVNDLRPDLIVFTGDVAETMRAISASTAILSDLCAPHGVVAVLGNHDYNGPPQRRRALIAALQEAGIVLLRNDVHTLSGTPLHLVGIDDAYTGHDKVVQALERLPQRRGVRIMLSHYPDVAERLAPGTVDLVLSGHTHGGQIRLPVLASLAVRYHARSSYMRGLYSVGGTPLYVNRGLGSSFPQARFLSPPEITHITLTRLTP